MNQYGIQLYSVRDFMNTEEEIRTTFRKLKNMGYDQVQTAGCAVDYEVFGKIAEENGMEIIGTHDDFEVMKNDFERALNNHRLLHTANMGIGGRKYESVSDVLQFIEDANAVAEKVAQYGMKFTYHNHSHEFYRWENGKTTMDMLAENFHPENVTFVLDTYWVQQGGGDIRHWIEKLKGRIDILHLKDMKRIAGDNNTAIQQITEIGNGNLYWEGILAAARECGITYYIVEQDHMWAQDCFASAKESIDYLRRLDGQMTEAGAQTV